MKIRSKEPLVIEAWVVPQFRGFVACLGLGLNHGNSPLSPKTGDAATPNNLTFGKSQKMWRCPTMGVPPYHTL